MYEFHLYRYACDTISKCIWNISNWTRGEQKFCTTHTQTHTKKMNIRCSMIALMSQTEYTIWSIFLWPALFSLAKSCHVLNVVLISTWRVQLGCHDVLDSYSKDTPAAERAIQHKSTLMWRRTNNLSCFNKTAKASKWGGYKHRPATCTMIMIYERRRCYSFDKAAFTSLFLD